MSEEALPGGPPWWSNAIFYQVYPRSFADSNGDGVGDLDGLVAHLDHLSMLGIDAIWLNPVNVSPMADHGYDVSDPRDVDPLFGGLEALERLIAQAHGRDIRVTMDLVPNHTSSQHAWFQAALSAGPGSAERARYIFRDGRGDPGGPPRGQERSDPGKDPRGQERSDPGKDPRGQERSDPGKDPGGEPPNNWVSVFGGPAWTRVAEADGAPGQWYLHLFDAEQPDLNWDNPEVFDDLEKTLRFWLDRGVDGFRIDVAHGMSKPPGLPDMKNPNLEMLTLDDDDPRFNHDGVHDIHRGIRSVLDDYPHAVSIGEIWVFDNEDFAKYLRPDELHMGFNFRLVRTEFDAADIHGAIENALAAAAIEDASPTWTLSNHDVDREVTRYGGGARGLARARAMAMVMLALPGAVFLYNGEELGLPNVDLPDEVLQDPVWERSGHVERGRDACRVPMPWEGAAPPFGFSTNPHTWLPMPPDWASLTVARQLADPDSTLTFFRDVLHLRRNAFHFTENDVLWLQLRDDALAFSSGGVLCVLNTGTVPLALPDGEVLAASAPLSGNALAPDSAVWLLEA